MKTNRLILAILVLCCWSSLQSAVLAQDDTRALYETYLSAYQGYQAAVTQGAPEAEVRQKLAAFNQARGAYERAVAAGQTAAPAPSEDWSGSDATPQLSLPGNLAEPQPVAPKATPVTAGAVAKGSVRKVPAALTATIKELWSGKGAKVVDKAIRSLDRYISANPRSPYAVVAKYEVARAQEYLQVDNTAALKTLNEIMVDPQAGGYARVAKDRILYLESTRQYTQWKVLLDQRRDEKEAAYNKYHDTSWLAFPVKLFRWTGYVGKLATFQHEVNKFEEFEIRHEAVSAPFVPPVDIAFDLFRTADGSEDTNATVRLVYDNNTSWYARWKLLNEARHSIDLQYFIVEKDIFGMALCGVLLRKAREGIKIRFMMDARGTKGLTRKFMGQDFIQELAAYPNVEVKTFNPVHTNLGTFLLDIRQIIASNHDKIVVVDDEYAVVGGRNVSSHYYVNPEDMPTCYRDCDVVIHSPAVARQLAFAFEEEFKPLKQYSISKDLWGNIDIMSREMEAALRTMGQYIAGRGPYTPPNPDKRTARALKDYNKELAEYKHMTGYEGFRLDESTHVAPVKVIDKHSLFGPRNDIADQLVRFIDGARKEIIIQNPYVVLTERAEAALKRAARRGVRILFHTNSPASTDSLATQAMFYGDWKRILKEIPTCRIFTYYGKRKLHAKNFVFDGIIGIVGTYNMDFMSQEINSEVVAAIKSTAFGGELRSEILSDIGQSKEYRISVDAEGKVTAVFGPDDLPGKNMWLMRFMSKLRFLKKLI